jgi:putative radical SAM enzyme (TIGR03279 family)
MSGGVISAVAPDSIAEAIGIQPGDVLLAINGHVLRDVLDVQFYAADEELELLVRQDDSEILYEIERDYDTLLGLDFSLPTFDGMRRCRNHCEFCFVAQMPPHLRRSLYVRDDDYRYSVLYGSFITLTNLRPEDWERFEEQRLSPLYVSVHATDPDLRRRLLGREDAPDIVPQLDRLAGLGIEVHAQVVLTPGLNDGAHLVRTVSDLVARYPAVQSIGVVPVGLTRYHRGGCRRYTAEEARAVIDQVAPLQQTYRQQYGASVAHLSDEWYLLADVDVPPDDAYDDYPQIENGIGLVRQFLDDWSALEAKVGALPGVEPGRTASSRQGPRCTLACGTLVAPLMARLARALSERSGVAVQVVPVANRMFGETVTVSGLLAGEDLVAALTGRSLGDVVFLPGAMFAESRPDGDTLDGLTVQDLEVRLGCRVVPASWMSEVWDELVGVDERLSGPAGGEDVDYDQQP